MDYKKIREERISFFILAVISFAIVLISGVSVLNAMKSDEIRIVKIIASSAIMFFGFYGLTTFVKRLSFVYLAEKIGNGVIYDRLRDSKSISQKFNVPQKKAELAFKFLIDNNYIEGYKIEGSRIVCLAEEKESQQHFVDATAKREAETKRSKKKSSARCENCGANIVFEGEQTVCPYCGNLISSKNN